MNGFNNCEFEKYEAEAQGKWGETAAYKAYEEKNKAYSKAEWGALAAGMDAILADLAMCMKNGDTPDSDEAQKCVETLQNHITENYYPCTNEILAGLGQMYVEDERFKNNIDKHACGTAAFISKAIKAYCNS